MARSFFCVIASLILFAAPATGIEPQAPPQTARPRIALVLSGGGALGLAHVGVLQVLEELRVPVDLVVGTSMGALAGGLYAAGYSPEELEALAHGLPWRDILLDRPQRRRLPFRRKIDDLTYLTRWEVGFSKGKLRLPPSVIPGHRLGVELRLLCLRAAGITAFDDLPIPFRAVAADLGSGRQVIMENGDLASALRASMAVPGVFAPAEMDGRWLVDGGVVANLPVSVARAMGADIIIAVDLVEPLEAQARPDSIAGIISRTSAFLTRLNVEKELPDVDILIRPDVREWKLLDFHASGQITARGAEGARSQADALRALAVGDTEWQGYLARQRRTDPTLKIASVTVDPGPGLSADTVSRQVRTRPGASLDPAVLRADLTRLWELGEFVTTDFSVTPQDGGWALRLVGHSKPWGPNYLRFGAAIFTDLEGESQFDTQVAYTMTRLNRHGAELKTAVQVGQNPIGQAEFYQPLARSRVPFLAASIYGGQTKWQIPVHTATEQYRFWVQRAAFDLGISLGRYGELRAGVRRDDTRGRTTRVDANQLPKFDHSDGGMRVALTIDQLDSINFPRRGFLGYAEHYQAHQSLGGDVAYRRLEFSLVAATTHRRHTLIALAHGGSALGGTLPTGQRLQLGGLFSLSGLPRGEVSGSYGGVAGLIYLFRLGRLPNFGEGIYAGVSLETGNLWETREQVSSKRLRRSFAAVFAADTILGPVYVAHGTTSGGKDSFYLLLGRTF